MTEIMDRRANPAMAFIKTYWFLIVFGLSVMGGGITLWFKVEYVVQLVNPQTIVEHREKSAILSTKREIRWCLGKAALDRKTALEALECAD